MSERENMKMADEIFSLFRHFREVNDGIEALIERRATEIEGKKHKEAKGRVFMLEEEMRVMRGNMEVKKKEIERLRDKLAGKG